MTAGLRERCTTAYANGGRIEAVQGGCTVSVIIEVRAAEGGDDAKSLVLEQFQVYRKWELRGRL